MLRNNESYTRLLHHRNVLISALASMEDFLIHSSSNRKRYRRRHTQRVFDFDYSTFLCCISVSVAREIYH